MDDAWAKAHYRLGCALTAYGEYALAERSFEAARKIAPGDAAVRERLAAASGACDFGFSPTSFGFSPTPWVQCLIAPPFN